MVVNDDIWNMSIPEGIKHHFLFETPTNRKEWAKYIYDTIQAIECSTCSCDKHNLKILDDAYDYCLTYDLDKMRNRIVELHTNFFTSKPMAINMNDLRSFFHDEWFNPTNDNRLTFDRYQIIGSEKE